MSLLLSRVGGAPPATPSIVESWWTVWDDAEHDDEGDGWWLAAVYESLAAPVIDPVFGLFEVADEDDAEAPDFGAAFTPPFNDFVPGAFEVQDEIEEDEAPPVVPWIDPPAAPPVVIDPVMGWAEVLEEEDEESPWAGIFPHGAELGPDPISGFFEVVEEEAEDAIDAAFASVIAANDFVQGLLDLYDEDDDEGLFEALWNPAFDPDVPPVIVQPVQQPASQGDDPSRIGRYRHTDFPARFAPFADLPDVSDESPAAERRIEVEPKAPVEARVETESTKLARSILQEAREAAQASAQIALELSRQKARDRTLAIIIAIAEADDD